MVNSHHTQANREKVIATQQTGAVIVTPQSLAETYQAEIDKARKSIVYITMQLSRKIISKERAKNLIKEETGKIERFEKKLSELEAQEPKTFTVALINPAYDPEMRQTRKAELVAAYRHLAPEAQANVREELAEIEVREQQDGSDTDLETKLNDAGYGSQGPY